MQDSFETFNAGLFGEIALVRDAYVTRLGLFWALLKEYTALLKEYTALF